MSLQKLKDRFKTANNTIVGTDQFLFDDLSGIDSEGDIDYPLTLLKVPQSTENKFGDGFEVFDVTFYVFKLAEDLTTEEMVPIWDEIQKIQRDLIAFVVKDRQDFIQTDKIVKYVRGHNEIGNDQTIAIKCDLQIRVHDATFCK